MRNLLALFAVVALTVGGLGWYLDWYKVRSTLLPSGHRSVNIDINGAKINDDLHKGGEKILHTSEEKLHEVLDKTPTDEISKRAESITNHIGPAAPNQ